jgi:hypothetical protein
MDFSTESLLGRMKQYARAAGGQSTIPAEYFDRYADQLQPRAQAAVAPAGGSGSGSGSGGDPLALEEKAAE